MEILIAVNHNRIRNNGYVLQWIRVALFCSQNKTINFANTKLKQYSQYLGFLDFSRRSTILIELKISQA